MNLTRLFAEHCKILLEDVSATATNGNKKMAKRFAAVGKAIIALYASVYGMSFDEADDYLYIVAYGSGDDIVKKLKEVKLCSPDQIFRKFSDCIKKHSAKSKYSVDIATEVAIIYAEWKRLSFGKALNMLCAQLEKAN